MAVALVVALGVLVAVTRERPAVDLYTDAPAEAGSSAGRDAVEVADQPVARLEVTPTTDPSRAGERGPAATSGTSTSAVDSDSDPDAVFDGAADVRESSILGQAHGSDTADKSERGDRDASDVAITSPTSAPRSIFDSGPASTVAVTAPAAEAERTGAPIAMAASDPMWCEVEVRASDGVLRWDDADRTAIFRRNGGWYHTPDEDAVAVLIPEPVDRNDVYVLRVWGGGGSQDVPCTFVAAATRAATSTTVAPATTATTASTAAPTPTTAAPTTTTTTTPESLAYVELPAPIAVPGGPVQMGFNADLWGQDRTNYWNQLEQTPGKGRLIAHEFKTFTKPLNTSLYRWHMAEGRDLLLTWNGTQASAILDGTHDDWIRDHARQLQALPGTVMLRFWHEPDVSYKASWIEGDPQNFIDSWMHVRRLFVEEGAVANIEWVWCPTAWNWSSQGARFYPGDANVDWICADGYSGWDLDKPLTPVQDAFAQFQAWANQHPTKPILIAEFGATARGPGERAAWVEGIPAWVNASPNIRAVVYFDFDKRAEEGVWDWRLRTEPDAWQAMLDVLGSAPF